MGEKITEEQLKQAVITEPLTFTANFVKDAPNEFNVTHEFKVAKDSPIKEMPADIKIAVYSQLPDDKKAEDGKTTTPGELKNPENVEDKTNDGVWKFEGFKDQNPDTKDVDAKVNGADVTFEGTWKFTPNKHKVTYEYVSGTEGKELPEALKAKAPKEVTGKVKGNTVTSPVPTGDDATFRDDKNKGTWTFKSYDKNEVEITNKDENVKGTWEFTPDPEPGKYNVTHKFVSKDPNKELPKEVLALVPADQTGKVKGDVVKPTEPQTKTVNVEDGTWTFVEYDKNQETIDNKDVEFTGTWEFTPKTTPTDYNVNHKFVSSTEGKALPKAVTDLTPDQQTGKKDGETVTPTAPKETTVEDAGNDGTWKFEGYDKDSKTIDKSDVTFEGKWKFTPNKHKVTYEYVSGTKGKELPEALKAKAPKEATGKVKGDKVTSPVPEGKDAEFRDETNKGTWTFKSYDKNEVEITNKDENVKGTWVFTPDSEPNKYNVKHEFVSATEGKTLPQAVKELTPKDQTGKEDGSVVKPTEPEKTKVADTENDGTWTFEGYKDQDKTTDEVDAKVNGADVKFEGEWKFTPNEHQVTYKFESEDPTKPLPKEVTDLLPDPEKGKVKGDKVTPTKPIPESITTKDGVWTFVKYDKDSETVDNKDLVFTGTWKFSPKPVPTTYKVNHQFKSATKGKDLPQAVKDQLPDQQTGIEDKSTVTPTAPKKEKVEDTDNDGIWKFKGYKDLDENTEKVDAKVDGADVMFEGSWEFTPNKHKVTYEYVSGTEGKELPAELKAKAPKEVTGKVKGDKVTSPVPEGKDAEFRDDKNKGTWTFKSFDKNSVEISNQDEKVTGTWVFTPDPEYKVEHKFVSSTKGKDLPKAVTNLTPKDQTGKKDGETVTPTAPKETKVEDKTNDGTWTFEGYDKDSKTIDKSDVTFEGKWKFTPNKHEVIHKFVSKDPNKKLPKEVTDLLPANQTGKVKGDEVTPTEPKTKTVKVKDGTWKFVSYDKENKKVEDKDVEFTGTWEFIPDVVTEYVDENGKTIAPKEDGTKPNKEIDGYKFVKTEKDDKGNTKHIYKKKVTPPADVVTEYVDEDGNTIAPKENGKQTNKDIDGYEFVKTTTDDKGNTKHIYKKKTTPSPSIVTKFVDEKGNPLAKDEDGKQDKKDFPGYEFVETKNDKDGNVVHVYKLIPTTTVETRYVDTEGKQILADKAGTHDPSTIEGYQFVKTEKDEKGNTVHIYKKLAPVPKVETRYVDENGNQLLPPKEGTQNQANIDGYDYVSTNKDNNDNTIHVYKKKPTQDIETRYLDTEGNQILADKAGTHDPSNIEGYQLVRTEKDEKGNTRHIYQKLAPAVKVETRYVDENGNQLLLPKDGTQNQVNIEGYDYVSTNKDNNGNTIHVYKKKVLTPDVVTKYVDENGNEIADTQKGKHPSKNIEGYEIITTKTDEKGNIIYVYRKKPDPTKVVTKFVDEKGNPVAESEDGKKPKKDIKGYEFVKTETDKDGNTIHIYKKKENTPKVVTKFVDEKGNPIAENEDGKKPKKDIKGYEFVKTETDKNGNTIHIYKKSSSTENKYRVTHKFESSTPGKSLPKEILDLLPKNQDGIENGRKVSPTKPSKLEVKVKDGTWVFEGYDKDSSVVNNKDVNFTGKWKFVPNKIGKIKVSTGTNSRSKSNVKTGIEGSSNLIFVLIGSAFALYKNKKNKY
ncbi:SHIRT domain-containing protein [Anaerococcus vaginalis]|uniref:SHIRT domain-containing protein n=1 Tax=Anaerococcus vaginalis TaxID=33037 RepID=UPI0028FF48DE|nr:SHIRT domain-containing protein [Anaerococcus vaginalis]MDU2648960.1 SHIRT domain-containing protein [Anaerococcus vaginalis]